jgi:hypothetical protein
MESSTATTATAIGYATLAQFAALIIIVILVIFKFGVREGFSVARLSVQEGIPGPVWWYYPMSSFQEITGN